MKLLQIPPFLKKILFVFALVSIFFTVIISYTHNLHLFWLLIITIPLLFCSIFLLIKKEKKSLNKYFLWQKINTINANYKPLPNTSPLPPVNRDDLSITIGNESCTQPYTTSIYNILIRHSMNTAARLKAVEGLPAIEDTNEPEERMHTYHFTGGGELIQIGPSYAGCRTGNGGFDAKKFKQKARQASVKIIELNLSDANRKIETIFSETGIENPDFENDSFSFSTMGFTTFSTAEGMVHFLDTLRLLSGGKPIGIRVAIRNKKKFYQICHAMMKSCITPDFIIVEGADKNAGFETNRLRMSLYDALLFVSKMLQVYGIDKKTKIIASAYIVSGFDLLKLLALGANAVYSEMPGYRIINRNGDDINQVSVYNTRDVSEFHENILDATARLMETNRLNSTTDITIAKLLQRIDLFFSKKQSEQFGSEKELNQGI